MVFVSDPLMPVYHSGLLLPENLDLNDTRADRYAEHSTGVVGAKPTGNGLQGLTRGV